MDRAAPPTTRRELRLAEASAQRRRRMPFTAIPAAAFARSGSAIALPLSARTAVAVAVSAALCGAGMAQIYSNGVDLTQRNARAAVVAAADAKQEAQRLRVDQASTARLEGQGVRFAAGQRITALAAARTAVATAHAVASTAVADVAPEALTPLGDAAATLAAMIVALPASTSPEVLSAVATPVASTATATTSTSTSTATAPSTSVAAEPAPGEPPVAALASTPTAAIPASAPGSLFIDPVAAAAAASSDTKPGASVLVPASVARDLEASARMLAAAVGVLDLSGQLQAVAAANVVAAAEAAAAEATAKAYARTHSISKALARKVTAADSAANGALPIDQLCAPAFAPSALLRCDAARALEALDVAYRGAFGTHLVVTSTYRTLAEQVDIKASRGSLAATPGSSNHGRGIATDLGGLGRVGQFTGPTYLWMKAHAGEFGWNHPRIMEPGGGGPQEPWHWEFDTA